MLTPMTGFHWLASYPKSGNTWLRLALGSFKAGGASPDLGIQEGLAPIASARAPFEAALDVESSDLTHAEVAKLRPRQYEEEARLASEPLLRKVHDAWSRTPAGEPLFPPGITLRAVYIVRDPRDVAPSLANHLNLPVDEAIDFMASPRACLSLSLESLGSQLTQRLLSWGGHVQSWLCAPLPAGTLLLLRYEDMLADPATAIARVAVHLGWPHDPDLARAAAEATRFDRLQAAEKATGFRGRPPAMDAFFRRGVAGGWRDTLSAEQVSRIEAAHGAVMADLGYL